jgi:DNA-binding response OmpR family regulator
MTFIVGQVRRPTVLLVDDEPAMLRLLSGVLAAHGYAVIAGDNPREAAWSLADSHIDAAILDIRLKGDRTGIDILQDLRTDPARRRMPVLLFTGLTLSMAEENRVHRLEGRIFQKSEGLGALMETLDGLLHPEPDRPTTSS